MDEVLRQQIKSNLSLRETDDLVEIWQQHNTDEWEEETFEIVREILIVRLGTLPDISIPAQLKQIFLEIDDLREAGDYTNALIECEKAVQLAPDDAVAHHYRGLIFDDLKFSEQALADYREAVRLDPGFEDAWDNLKSLEKEMGIEEKGYIESQSEPDFTSEHQELSAGEPPARGLSRTEDVEMALLLREQIRNNFEQLESSVLVRIWKVHDTHEWTEVAFDVLREILFKRLGSIPKLAIQTELNQIFDRIDTLREAKDFSFAMDECRQAARLANNDPKVQNYLGLVHEDLGETGEALACYQKAIRLDPEFEDAMDNLRSVEKGIEKAYKESVAKRHFDQAITYAEDEEMVGALQLIELGRQDLPKIAAAYNDYGLALHAVKKFDEAIDAFLEAIRLNPHYSGVRANLRNTRVKQEEARYISAATETADVSNGEQDLSLGFSEKAFEEKQVELMDTPAWMYMNKDAHLVTGTSGHRTRPGRSGYDPLDTRFEGARMESSLLCRLFTGKLRTHDPVYLTMMIMLGLILGLPVMFSLGTNQHWDIEAFILIFPLNLVGITGLAVLVNVALSFFSKKPDDDENGSKFF